MYPPSLIKTQISANVGHITLCRPQALNALSLGMIRELFKILKAWQENPQVEAVAIRGSNKEGPFGAFCAGGDIRFFYHAGIEQDLALESFFSEEYALNHLIFNYRKPYLAFMDGIVMGGGMGICQGASLRIVTERSKLAMPEINIGLFPDVGGGYFLSRCEGALGEYLALTGQLLTGGEAISLGLADAFCDSRQLTELWGGLTTDSGKSVAKRIQDLCHRLQTSSSSHQTPPWFDHDIDNCFSQPSISAIFDALANSDSALASASLNVLQKRSPLMLYVTLKQIRLGRDLSLADNLRMERNLVHHCFNTIHLGRSGANSEAVEGIRALVIDKDHHPNWKPAKIDQVTAAMVDPFFISPWPEHKHPLAHLK